MQQLHSDVWVTSSPLRFLGVEVGARGELRQLIDQHCFVAPPAQEATAALLADVSERRVRPAVVAVASLARPRPGVAPVEVQRFLDQAPQMSQVWSSRKASLA